MGSKYSKKYFFWFLSPLVLYQVDLICLTDVLFSLNTHDGQFGLSQKLKGNSKELCTICVLFNIELFSRNPAPVKTQPVKGYQPSPPPHFKIIPPHYQDPTLPANPSSQVFPMDRNATVKLSSINTSYVKQNKTLAFSSSSSL